VFDVLQAALEPLGFTVHRMIDGEAPDGPVENLFATRGSGGPHLGFAGHLDVVPPGAGWTTDPFDPDERGGLLYGRGAVDMKGSIACFVAAAAAVREHAGTLSLIITGDEEGPSVHGTRALMAWMAQRNIRPDMILIGEPTSEDRLGDIVKIGRRGSVNMLDHVPGVQGHVAYPAPRRQSDPKLARVVERSEALHLDDGNERFPAVQPRDHRRAHRQRRHQRHPRHRHHPAQHPLQQPPARRGSGRAGPPHRREAAPGATVEAKISGEPSSPPRARSTKSSARRSAPRPASSRSSPPTAARRTAAS
jgi:acetylornithine deacetylase/succinyl-diaminopimelate desuccinylase-like protein